MADANMDVHITMEQEEDYQFTVTYDRPEGYTLQVDEPKPHGGNSGPNPTRLIATSVGHCLTASLIFCLDKRDVDLEGCSTEVHAHVERNEDGFWRIQNMTVDINIGDLNEEQQEAFEKCRPMFEDYCVATQSIRQGIPVELKIN